MILLIVSSISDGLALATWEVAIRHRYIGKRDSGIIVIGAFSSLSNSLSALLVYANIVKVTTYYKWIAVQGEMSLLHE
jgi:hypothetical protein